MPKIKDFTFKIVETTQQLDELLRHGFDLSLLDVTQTYERLEKGAVGALVFIGGELANLGWVARTKEAKELFDSLPYKVDFANQHAWTGGTLTKPKYRGWGLFNYSGYKRIEILREMGVSKVRVAVEVSNIASNKGTTKHGYKIYAKGRYLKILWWKSWKETPVD